MKSIRVENGVFHLSNQTISYLFYIEEGGILSHLYFGKKIAEYQEGFRFPRVDRSFAANLPNSTERVFSLDTVLQEFPGNGNGDFREPAQMIRHPDGSTISDFRYDSYEIISGKPKLKDLPATYVEADAEADTLKVTLKDEVGGLYLDLYYTIFADQPLVSRWSELRNVGEQTVHIQKLASSSLDFPKRDLELLHLCGSWSRERTIEREVVHHGIKKIDSKRGSSSHFENPFVALLSPHATETVGDVYGFSLVYSGNHEAIIQKDAYDQTRVVMGINSFGFDWPLAAGESFVTPEVVMAYSSQGLNQMSQAYHELYRNRLVRGKFRNQERPILANNWEATFFDFDDQKIMAIADEAKDLGVELFVLDDGWFGHRDSDNSSLGDWVEDRRKLKHGLKALAEAIKQNGMQFGLWFEPEMISEDSELFKSHPDWAFHVPGRPMSPGRGQFVLDFSRADVRENIFQQMKNILDEVPIDYIKWDMNRNMTEVYSSLLTAEEQGTVAHRYMLGLYDLLEKLTQAYPDILFESCSGGGGRFDPGMLYYMPQVWTSDNTDAISRLKIQYGTSLVYPISSMGAHVAAVPNHQTGRITSLQTRGAVAMSGVFGYELDLTTLSPEEKAEFKEQVAFYKKHRQLIQYGEFIRLRSPFEKNQTAWMFIAPDRKEALVFYYQTLAEAVAPFEVLQLGGLDAEYTYHVAGDGLDLEAKGDQLMNLGLYMGLNFNGDFQSSILHLQAQ
ncbi:alpha-galactosidase [Enterococcus sp. LJL120]